MRKLSGVFLFYLSIKTLFFKRNIEKVNGFMIYLKKQLFFKKITESF